MHALAVNGISLADHVHVLQESTQFHSMACDVAHADVRGILGTRNDSLSAKTISSSHHVR